MLGNRGISIQLSMMIMFFISLIAVPSAKIIESQEDFEAGTVITDRYGIEMVYVPGGSFEMGIEQATFSQLLEEGLYPDVPSSQHDFIVDELNHQGVFETIQVEIPSFFLDRYEVTIAQYEDVFEGCLDFGICTEILRTTNHDALNANPRQPQVGVTWFNALHFCNARGMRLPTEFEWEYAARGSESSVFPWGNRFISEYVVSVPDAASTDEVGTRSENVSWVGAYDLIGNAGEWVEGRPLPYDNGSESQFSQTILDTHRVFRGGTYASNLIFVNSIARGHADPRTGGDIGVRCARSAHS